MILAGDIGGTKTNLAFFEVEGERLEPLAEGTFPSRDYASLDEIARQFVAAHVPRSRRLKQACFGVAGPIKAGRCEATNLAWIVDGRRLAIDLGLEDVWLINDLEATAYGIATLPREDFVTLNQGAPDAEGNAVVIAAGTGLGEAGLYWDGTQHHPFACEGGHTDFAPRHALELELLRYLLPRFEHVSYERVLSGPGLYNIYTFLRDTGHGEEPTWLVEEMRQHDPSAVISEAGLRGTCTLCVQALHLFASIYGAAAGNLALKVMATGGVFVGGGIAPKIIDKLQDGTFMQAFTAKGRLKPMLEAMPVRVILNDKTALRGAARYAMRQRVNESTGQ